MSESCTSNNYTIMQNSLRKAIKQGVYTWQFVQSSLPLIQIRLDVGKDELDMTGNGVTSCGRDYIQPPDICLCSCLRMY